MPSLKLKVVETSARRAVRAELLRQIANEILSVSQIDCLETLVAAGNLVQAQLYMSDRVDDCSDNSSISAEEAARYYRMIALPVEQVSRHRQKRYANVVAQLAEAQWEEVGDDAIFVRFH